MEVIITCAREDFETQDRKAYSMNLLKEFLNDESFSLLLDMLCTNQKVRYIRCNRFSCLVGTADVMFLSLPKQNRYNSLFTEELELIYHHQQEISQRKVTKS
ncbi:hypothetical protein GLW00_00115 [Halobacillus litoralis]|uniref:Uncharacterized protein n=1 Tax=Halobacillus litoralis TaxID=45668 RepID=A0A845F556_9BACI|nr:hypothetical protein [Halobacillus litoralis]MYL69233.1 hypothetical protein [Halobacillus litoralis]